MSYPIFCAFTLAAVLPFAGLSRAQQASVGPSAKEVRAVLAKAVDFLKTRQNEDGSFSPKIAGPGISALVAAGLLQNGHSAKEPMLAKTLGYLEKQVQKDGGIYSKFLANYTTSVAIMAFKEANKDGKYDDLLKKAGLFIKGIQFDERNSDPKEAKFGGFGYDGKKSPDMSNSAFSVEALIAAGVSKDDPAIKKALQFIGRCQNLPGEFNDQGFAKKTSKDDQGGFVYRPDSDDKKHVTADGGLRSRARLTQAPAGAGRPR